MKLIYFGFACAIGLMLITACQVISHLLENGGSEKISVESTVKVEKSESPTGATGASDAKVL